jgi:hypothetical protein
MIITLRYVERISNNNNKIYCFVFKKKKLSYNSRPLQPINDRVVRRSWDEKFRRQHKQHQPTKGIKKMINKSNKIDTFSMLYVVTIAAVYFFKF